MVIKTRINGLPIAGGTDSVNEVELSVKTVVIETAEQVNTWYADLVTQVSTLRTAHSTLDIGVQIGEQPLDADAKGRNGKTDAFNRVPNLTKLLGKLSENISADAVVISATDLLRTLA